MVSRTNHRYGLLVIGIMLLAVACSTSTPVASQPPPTATVILTDTATPTDVPVSTSTVPPAIPGCPGVSLPYHWDREIYPQRFHYPHIPLLPFLKGSMLAL